MATTTSSTLAVAAEPNARAATQPVLIAEDAWCCQQGGNGFLAIAPRLIASPCGCAVQCTEDQRCSHFSHNPVTGRCSLCSDCELSPRNESSGRASTATAWRLRGPPSPPVRPSRFRECPVPHNATNHFTTGRMPMASRRLENWLYPPEVPWPPPLTKAAIRQHAVAHLVGASSWMQSTDAPERAAARRRQCQTPQAEERTFRETCTPLIRRMDRHLATNAGRRELYISFDANMRARTDIGWGHALPAAFTMHCERLDRVEPRQHDAPNSLVACVEDCVAGAATAAADAMLEAIAPLAGGRALPEGAPPLPPQNLRLPTRPVLGLRQRRGVGPAVARSGPVPQRHTHRDLPQVTTDVTPV